jgi:hypothetical protein
MGQTQSLIQSATKPDDFILVVKRKGCPACDSLMQLAAPMWDPTKHFVIDESQLAQTQYGPLVEKAYRMARNDGAVPLIIRVKRGRPKKVMLGVPPKVETLASFIKL